MQWWKPWGESTLCASLRGGCGAIFRAMPSLVLTALFWSAVTAALAAQAMLLRSTLRAWRAGGAAVPLTERVFAFGPALVLALVLWLSWRAATRPPIVEVRFDPATQGITL
jgi:hypothetical protein